jgi:hypothetical protein
MAFLFPTYFPFCIYEGAGDVGNGTAYPVGMTLEDAMTLYWKAKSFRIVETWNTAAQGGITTVVGSTDTILTPNGNLNKMSDLCCRPSIEASGSAGTFALTRGGDFPDGPYFFQDFLNLYLFQEFGVVFRDELYYPQISFLRSGGFQSYNEWFNVIAGNDNGYPATITINGNQYSFTVYDNIGDVQVYNNTTTNITIDSEREAD